VTIFISQSRAWLMNAAQIDSEMHENELIK